MNHITRIPHTRHYPKIGIQGLLRRKTPNVSDHTQQAGPTLRTDPFDAGNVFITFQIFTFRLDLPIKFFYPFIQTTNLSYDHVNFHFSHFSQHIRLSFL